MYNIFLPIEQARISNTFTNELNRYTQANCQVTLENGLLRIYRPPNALNKASGGTNNMWGGLRIRNLTGSSANPTSSNIFNLQEGHTYIIKFHVKGKTSNTVFYMRWTNLMGWDPANSGLLPDPSNVKFLKPQADFQGEMDCFYQFTLSDRIYKTCTNAYDQYVAGNTYLSYSDFQFSFEYTNTGELGTDLYLSNFRMYDLTNITEKIQVQKNTITKSILIEDSDYTKVSYFKDTEIYSPEFYEV